MTAETFSWPKLDEISEITKNEKCKIRGCNHSNTNTSNTGFRSESKMHQTTLTGH